MGLNAGCSPGLEVILATRGPLPRGAECPRHGAVAIGRPPRRGPSPCRGGDRPAWEAIGAEGWLLANDSDFLLKFMRFPGAFSSSFRPLRSRVNARHCSVRKGEPQAGSIPTNAPSAGSGNHARPSWLSPRPSTSGPAPRLPVSLPLSDCPGLFLSTWRWL